MATWLPAQTLPALRRPLGALKNGSWTVSIATKPDNYGQKLGNWLANMDMAGRWFSCWGLSLLWFPWLVFFWMSHEHRHAHCRYSSFLITSLVSSGCLRRSTVPPRWDWQRSGCCAGNSPPLVEASFNDESNLITSEIHLQKCGCSLKTFEQCSKPFKPPCWFSDSGLILLNLGMVIIHWWNPY